MGIFPRSERQSAGFGVVGGLSTDLERRPNPVLSLGGIFYVAGESSREYISFGTGIFYNSTLGSVGKEVTSVTISFGLEFGGFDETKATPFISITGATSEDGDATIVALSVGFRLPVGTRKKVGITPGVLDEID